jgi:glyoxylase-like metal-dependent hydrolase (beta-lactamase superfamily II)
VRIRTFTGGSFGQNGYLAVCEASGAAVAVDPGAAAAGMVRHLQAAGTPPTAILLTHAHLDHIEGIPTLRAAFPDAPIHLHPGDRPLYDGASRQGAAFGHAMPELPPPDHDLAAGERFVFGSCSFEVRHSPGHTPGHVILYAADAGVALVGDVVFAGSIGRADLPGGDFRTLIESIRREVLSLPPETRLFSGHGPETTVDWEARHNPFLIPHSRGELA